MINYLMDIETEIDELEYDLKLANDKINNHTEQTDWTEAQEELIVNKKRRR